MTLIRRTAVLTPVALVLALAAGSALAGTTGTEFQTMYTTLLNWATGFLGKSIALAVQLAALEVVLLAAAVFLYKAEIRAEGLVLLVTTFVAATIGLAFVGTLYGGLAAGAKGRETLLPLLMFPVVAPVLIGATRATEAALGTADATPSDGWPWIGLLALFAVAFGAGGTLAFGSLIDE